MRAGPVSVEYFPLRHPGEGRGPGEAARRLPWVPAFAGTTRSMSAGDSTCAGYALGGRPERAVDLRELECEDDEDRFEKRLGKIAKAKPDAARKSK
jgi:hypothetical protein